MPEMKENAEPSKLDTGSQYRIARFVHGIKAATDAYERYVPEGERHYEALATAISAYECALAEYDAIFDEGR